MRHEVFDFNYLMQLGYTTVKIGIIGPRARTLELPLLVRSGSFFFLFCLRLGLRGQFLLCPRPPIQEREFRTSKSQVQLFQFLRYK